MSQKSKLDLSRADPLIVEVAVEEAREQIEAMFRAALAADQRALLLGSILVATGIAALGAAGAALDGSWLSGALPWGMLLSGILLVSAAAFALLAARPLKMPFPGNEPKNWAEDLAQGLTLEEVRADQLAELQRTTERMDAVLSANGKRVTWSLRLSFAAALVVVATASTDAAMVFLLPDL